MSANNIFNFKANYFNDDEERLLNIDHTVHLEDAHLSELLYAFKSFLQAAGYNYVKEVYAVNEDGVEVGEE